MKTPPTTYTVQVDDCFHYMEESHRVQDGTFDTLEEAVNRCKAITNASLEELHREGMSASDLYRQYLLCGEDAWITVQPNDGAQPHFSARDYAKAKAADICQMEDAANEPEQNAVVDDVPRGTPEQLFAMLAVLPARTILGVAASEGLLRATLAAGYPRSAEKDLAPDSEEAAEAATQEERTMHCAAMTWARLRADGQAVLIEVMKQAVWKWEEAVGLLRFWAPGELPEDANARRLREAAEEQEQRRQEIRAESHGSKETHQPG